MKWDDKYSLGDTAIDDHHKKIFQMISALQTSSDEGGLDREVKEIVDELVEYTNEHFVEEEGLMAKFDYPGLDGHKLLHHRLIEDIHGIIAEIETATNVDIHYLISFLEKWINDHILGEDLKFGDFLKENGHI